MSFAHTIDDLELWTARSLLRLPAPVKVWLSGAGPVVIDGQVLHPEMQLLLALRARRGGQSLSAGGVEAARQRLASESLRFAGPPVKVQRTSELRVAGGAGMLDARHYVPESPGQAPLLVYFHGGGFVAGSVETHDRVCRILCAEAQVHVLSVEYRLAPEHPFPAAVEDAVAAFGWAAAHAGELGADATRVGVGGDSAGGNLAVVVSHVARRGGAAMPALQLLIYPPVDRSVSRPSMSLFDRGFLLTAEDVRWFDRQYFTDDPARLADPRAAPLRSLKFEGLPPAVVAVAGFDPLRDEANAYAAALTAAGVPTKHLFFPGLIHGFVNMTGVSPAAREAVIDIARALRAAFSGDERAIAGCEGGARDRQSASEPSERAAR